MFISSVVWAEEELPSENQILAEDDGAAEGRACYDCNGGGNVYQPEENQNTEVYQYTKDFSWLWGIGGVVLCVLPIYGILAVNIVVVSIVSAILKKVDKIYEHQSYYQHAYAYPTYQTQGATATHYQGHDAYSTYQPQEASANHYQGHGSSSSYSKRSIGEGLVFPSQSTLQFLTDVIGDAIKKYNDIDTAE